MASSSDEYPPDVVRGILSGSGASVLAGTKLWLLKRMGHDYDMDDSERFCIVPDLQMPRGRIPTRTYIGATQGDPVVLSPEILSGAA
jgi:hypothetical protein